MQQHKRKFDYIATQVLKPISGKTCLQPRRVFDQTDRWSSKGDNQERCT